MAERQNFIFTDEFSFAFKGNYFSLRGKEPVSDIMTLLKKMLNYLKSKNKKALITIDDVDNSDEMKYFIQGYVALLGQRHPMSLLMTGLHSNVSKLQNEKTLTFLYQAPKIQIGPLSLSAIAANFEKSLNITFDKVIELAKMTKGYAYAYQSFGYILFKENKKDLDKDVLVKFDQQMENYVYDKIYSEVSFVNKEILKAIEVDEPVKVSDLATKLNKNSQYINAYRDKLLKEGILFSPSYGYVEFALPRFGVFLKTK